MIKNVYVNGPFLRVDQTGQSYNTPYINMSNASAGMVRWNSNSFEVYDGSVWHRIGGDGQAMISMDQNAVSDIMWAEQKMREEAEMVELAKKHPAVEDAVTHLKDAQSRVKVVMALVKEEKV